MLCPPPGGGIVPAGTEFDSSGLAVLDTTGEEVRVLSNTIASRGDGEVRDPIRVVVVLVRGHRSIGDQSNGAAGAVVHLYGDGAGRSLRHQRFPGDGVVEHLCGDGTDFGLLDHRLPLLVAAAINELLGGAVSLLLQDLVL